MIAAVAGVALALVGLSAAQGFVFAAPCLILMSLSVSMIIGVSNTIVQERAPATMRGRVSAIAGLSFFGLMPFAALGITSVSDWVGMRTALLLSSGAYLAVAAMVFAKAGARMAEATAEPGLGVRPEGVATE